MCSSPAVGCHDEMDAAMMGDSEAFRADFLPRFSSRKTRRVLGLGFRGWVLGFGLRGSGNWSENVNVTSAFELAEATTG